MLTGGLTQREIKRLATLSRQLARAIRRDWPDDQQIIEAEITELLKKANSAYTKED